LSFKRLAPEHPFPAAVHDCWEALLWLTSAKTGDSLSSNATKMVIGGSSAGGNLAAILTHKALARKEHDGRPIQFLKQALVVPVTDNTADQENNWSWKEFENTAALPAVKMMWYRDHYLPNKSDWTDPEASPLLYDGDWTKFPPAVVIVGELDVLRAEGEQYAEKLRKAGVSVDLHVMQGMPHPFLAMDAVLEAGKKAIDLLCEAAESSFY
jgi:acetyl esterase/lipase